MASHNQGKYRYGGRRKRVRTGRLALVIILFLAIVVGGGYLLSSSFGWFGLGVNPTPTPTAIPSPTPSPTPAATPTPTPIQPPTDPVLTVVLDPGHGFYDPGTTTPEGMEIQLKESDVNLRMALALREILWKNNIEVVLTHDGTLEDWPENPTAVLKLTERVDIAKAVDPDCFVALHVNAFEDPDVKGMRIYYAYNSENKNAVSEELAQVVGENFAAYTGWKVPQVYSMYGSSAWYVIRKVDFCPSIFCEMGFITNPEDVADLSSDAFIRQAAMGVADGIMIHFGLKADPNAAPTPTPAPSVTPAA